MTKKNYPAMTFVLLKRRHFTSTDTNDLEKSWREAGQFVPAHPATIAPALHALGTASHHAGGVATGAGYYGTSHDSRQGVTSHHFYENGGAHHANVMGDLSRHLGEGGAVIAQGTSANGLSHSALVRGSDGGFHQIVAHQGAMPHDDKTAGFERTHHLQHEGEGFELTGNAHGDHAHYANTDHGYCDPNAAMVADERHREISQMQGEMEQEAQGLHNMVSRGTRGQSVLSKSIEDNADVESIGIDSGWDTRKPNHAGGEHSFPSQIASNIPHVLAKAPLKATPQQYRNFLLSNQVSNDEVKDSGIHELLKHHEKNDPDKSIPVAHLQHWHHLFSPQFGETHLGGKDSESRAKQSVALAAQHQLATDLTEDEADWNDLGLNGEHPFDSLDAEQRKQVFLNKELYKMPHLDSNYKGLLWEKEGELKGKILPQYESYTFPGGEDYQETLLHGKVSRQGVGDHKFARNHFSQPNMFAHVRHNERADAGGNNGTFIEEIQSDTHQGKKPSDYKHSTHEKESRENLLGKKEEFEGLKEKFESAQKNYENSDAANIESRLKEIHEEFKDAQDEEQRAALTKEYSSLLGKKREVVEATRPPQSEIDRYFEIGKEIKKIESQMEEPSRVDTPFKGDEWKNLALKRMLVHAAQNGHDFIAWTKGHHQQARFTAEDGTQGGNPALYDQHLPSLLKKLVKRYGLQDEANPNDSVQNIHIPIEGHDDEHNQFHGIRLTPAMREKILGQGFNLYKSLALDEAMERLHARRLGSRKQNTKTKQIEI